MSVSSRYIPVNRTAVSPQMVASVIPVKMVLIAGTSLAPIPVCIYLATMAQSVSTTTLEQLPHVIPVPVRTEELAALDVTHSLVYALTHSLALSVKLSQSLEAAQETLATTAVHVLTQPLGLFALVAQGSLVPFAAGRLTTVSWSHV